MDIMISIFYKAIMENDIESIKQLLKKQNCSLKDLIEEKHIERLLFLAIEQNYQELVFFLVNNGANVNIISKLVNMSPLILAISQRNVKMTELLLDLGADIGEGRLSQKLVCPLHFAVSVLNLDIVLLLLARGANVYARDIFHNETALQLVSNYNYVYSSEEDKIKKVQIQVKIAKALLEKGAEIDAKNCNGFTPVDCALSMSKTELCKQLFIEGASVKKTEVDGTYFEYLKLVVIYPCPQLTRICLERGCDFSRRDEVNGSLTPYHDALQFSIPGVVKVFLEFGCPFDLPVFMLETANVFNFYRPNDENISVLAIQKAFIEGVKKNCLQSVNAALTQGAEPKGCSMDVPSTLHHVVANDNNELVHLLLMKGVPVNRLNTKGETALFIAVKNKNIQSSETCLKFGACINFGKFSKNSSKQVFENCDKLQILFKTISKCFKLVKQGNTKVLKLVNNHRMADDNNTLSVLMNCVNRKGLSLMGVALKMGHTKIAVDLMKLRIDKF